MSAFIDTHAHLHDRAFADDREAVLQRARDAGVEAVLTVGTDLAESAAAVALARSQPDVFAVVGVHPHHASDWDERAEARIRDLAADDRVVAIGEIGLDFYRNLSPVDAQVRAFREQLALADDVGLPVVIHSRDADAECRAILETWAASSARERPIGVLHCFSGNAELATAYAALGFLISFAGPLTYPKNDALRAAAAALPIDSIVVETDCPYLTPQFKRGRRNEPAYSVETARCVAEQRAVSLEDVAAATSRNARRLFRLPVTETIGP